jgi:hypothetical protein
MGMGGLFLFLDLPAVAGNGVRQGNREPAITVGGIRISEKVKLAEKTSGQKSSMGSENLVCPRRSH